MDTYCFPAFHNFLSRPTGAKVPQERKLKGTKVVCGAKVPGVRKFHGTKVLVLLAPRERMFHGMKVLSVDFSLPGTKVQRNEKAWIRMSVGYPARALKISKCIRVSQKWL